MKQCSKCKELKDKSEFRKNRSRKDELSVWCKKCLRNYDRKRYLENSKPLKRYLRYEERHRTIDCIRQKRCSKCEKQKDESEFGKNRKNKDGVRCRCKECMRVDMQERYKQKRGSVKKYNKYKDLHRVAGGVKQKRCGKCKKWKAENQYYKHNRHKDGLSVWCKECANKATNKARKRRLAIRN